MKNARARLLWLLFIPTAVKGQTGLIAMPVEIGISQRSGKPFTATETTTLTQALNDGTKIVLTAEDRIARDNEGRWYKEQHLPWTHDPRNPVFYINVYDRVAKRRIHLDPQRHLAMQVPAEPAYVRDYKPDDELVSSNRRGEKVKTEKLGRKDIAGVTCWGRRTTRVVPPGAFGNNQAMEIVDELWYSDELGLDMMRRHSDPRSGVQISEIRDLQRIEPDPGMFKLPEGYTIQPSAQTRAR